MGYLKNTNMDAIEEDDRLRRAIESYVPGAGVSGDGAGTAPVAAAPETPDDAVQGATPPADDGDGGSSDAGLEDDATLGLAAAGTDGEASVAAGGDEDAGADDDDSAQGPAAALPVVEEDNDDAAVVVSGPAGGAETSAPAPAAAAEGDQPEVTAAAPADAPTTSERADVVSPMPEPGPAPVSVAAESLSAPAPAASMYTLARYLNEYNTPAGTNDFWDDFWGGGSDIVTPHINLTSSGTEAQNGTLYYNVVGNWYDSDGLSDDPYSATRIDAIRHALNVYEDILGINFVETTSTSASVVDLAFGNEVSGQAFANFSMGGGGEIYDAYINIAKNWSGTGNIGDYYFHTALHEIGHTLG
ncbi:hypothetical protein QO033_25220, partial [Pseudodonghicola sp. IC7]|nr:hypothetical protein [Pseudodonghicola flavimaris]